MQTVLVQTVAPIIHVSCSHLTAVCLSHGRKVLQNWFIVKQKITAKFLNNFWSVKHFAQIINFAVTSL